MPSCQYQPTDRFEQDRAGLIDMSLKMFSFQCVANLQLLRTDVLKWVFRLHQILSSSTCHAAKFQDERQKTSILTPVIKTKRSLGLNGIRSKERAPLGRALLVNIGRDDQV